MMLLVDIPAMKGRWNMRIVNDEFSVAERVKIIREKFNI